MLSAVKFFLMKQKKINCEPIMSRTGHSPIKEKMKELNSPLSGEMSGHVCYGDDFYGYDDAMYVGLRLLRILANQNRSLSELINIYPKHSQLQKQDLMSMSLESLLLLMR